ncbi:hypothetical protein T3A99_07375 [Pseudomonas sp. N-137]|uniref:hypothetical protein n=1 Tax=Pseudomonas sp. N-137 TaxID=3108452 RepID=UPI002ADEE3E2|nr:hypothetical protein [Pseudomonas sp. N-137]MEA1028388.1 hypothetical protein [Pseudomonas sp. N-137]
MDLFSLAVGFLTGAFTAAAGNYLADKYSDARREKEAEKKSKKLWREIKSRFPAVIEEMERDLRAEGGSGVRVFFVKSSYSMIGFASEPYFELHTDKHLDLSAAIQFLLDQGLIIDITPGNAPMYRMSERLVDLLLARKY